jgi:serine/threonine protein kinase
MFIIKEYAIYGDLYDLISDNPNGIDEKIVKYISTCLLDVLIYIYDIFSISHRDIKLENIFINSKGTIKLGDWGLAGFNVKGRKCTTYCGTDSYMSLEVFLGNDYNSQKSDVWSLAVVIFILLTGRRPYEEIKRGNSTLLKNYYLKQIIEDNWELFIKEHKNIIKHISKEFWDLLPNILNFKPNKRYTFKKIINDSWLKYSQINNTNIIELFR